MPTIYIGLAVKRSLKRNEVASGCCIDFFFFTSKLRCPSDRSRLLGGFFMGDRKMLIHFSTGLSFFLCFWYLNVSSKSLIFFLAPEILKITLLKHYKSKWVGQKFKSIYLSSCRVGKPIALCYSIYSNTIPRTLFFFLHKSMKILF